jgi:hypothetical protein
MAPGCWTEPLAIDAPEVDLAGKRLLIDNDSRLLTPVAVEALVTFVEAGGTLVLQRTSGQYAPGEVEPSWPLARALGLDVGRLAQPLAQSSPWYSFIFFQKIIHRFFILHSFLVSLQCC